MTEEAGKLVCDIRNYGAGLLDAKMRSPNLMLTTCVLGGSIGFFEMWRTHHQLSDTWWLLSLVLGSLTTYIVHIPWYPVARRQLSWWTQPLTIHYHFILVERGLLLTAIDDQPRTPAEMSLVLKQDYPNISYCLQLQPDLKKLNKCIRQLVWDYPGYCTLVGLPPFPPGMNPGFAPGLAGFVHPLWFIILILTVADILGSAE